MSRHPPRRGAIDVARVAALALVVLGHLTLAVIDRAPDGSLRGDNLVALHPTLAWLTMLAPMPVFFAAAGWANATGTLVHTATRLRTLVALAAAVVCLWSTAAGVAVLIAGSAGVVGDGARIATQPLWFLAAYVPFAAAGSTLARWAQRSFTVVGVCLGAVIALDMARFVVDVPDAVGWAGFWFAWAVPWLLGAAWRHRTSDGTSTGGERTIGVALFAGAAVVAIVLVARFGYSPALIDAVPGDRSNTSPPTVFTAVAAVAQVGLLIVLAPWLDRLAVRVRPWLDRAGEAAVAVYVWHLTALALCGALLAAGAWAPTRFGAAWWATRPVWFALVLGVTAVFAAASAAVLPRRTQAGRAPTPGLALAGVMAATVAAAVVGRWGPRTVWGAAVPCAGFVLATLVWRPRSAASRPPT